jgi:transmembrane protein EpsG
MLFWYGFLAIIYPIAFASYKHKSIQSLPWIFLFIVSAFRYNVGTDYAHYYHLFIHKDGMFEHKELGYTSLVNLLSSLDFNPQMMFFLFSLATIALFYKSFKYFFKDNDTLFLLSTLLFIPFFFFLSLNTIRQALAVAIFFYAIRYILNKCFFKYFIYILIAMMFHKSAIILIPLYFFFGIKLTRYRLFIICILAMSIFVFNPVNYVIEFYVGNKLPFYFYFNDEFHGENLNGFGRVIAILNVFLVLLLSLFMNKEKYLESIIFNMVIVFSIIKLLSLDIAIIDRMSIYFKPAMILFILFTINNVIYKIHNSKHVILIGIFALCLSYTSLVIYTRGESDESYNQYALNLHLFGKKAGVVQVYGNADKVNFR